MFLWTVRLTDRDLLVPHLYQEDCRRVGVEDRLPVSSWDSTITEPSRKKEDGTSTSWYDLKGMVFRVKNVSYY